eukprot:9712113-Alexandrium_andersonii.AAC.1
MVCPASFWAGLRLIERPPGARGTTWLEFGVCYEARTGCHVRRALPVRSHVARRRRRSSQLSAPLCRLSCSATAAGALG